MHKDKMASVENIPPNNNESEMEEGEIIDDLDDLSDISSEEEFLLRQRLQVLENYNNVLERKKAKKASILAGKNEFSMDMLLQDLSEISANELDENPPIHISKHRKEAPYRKLSHKHKKSNVHSGIGRCKEHKKRSHRKKKLEPKVISESSEESDDEYKNKRRKLADAVSLNKTKSDTSTLKDRLERMLCGAKKQEHKEIKFTKDSNCIEDKEKVSSIQYNGDRNDIKSVQEINLKSDELPLIDDKPNIIEDNKCVDVIGDEINKQNKETQVSLELIDLCSEDTSNLEFKESDVVDSSNKENVEEQDIRLNNHKQDSDDDLEILRQHALKTKNLKTKIEKPKELDTDKSRPLSDEDDSDTSELRLICLKSALLKKAIERKFKQKMRKRLKSKSMSLQDDLLYDQGELKNCSEIENNTDIESVDMDIGSDADDKTKDSNGNTVTNADLKLIKNPATINNNITKSNKYDELEEDEDLLRAKLLTSLSKNLPNLVDIEILNKIEDTVNSEDATKAAKPVEEKKFIINLEDSDSEAEHEATKNLTKMHMKLSEQVDFQQKLDLFLKSTRKQVESVKLPDVVQQPVVPKQHVKYVPKAVNHLPKSEQIEYKNLVKRMAELEKIKQARQISMNATNNSTVVKETLKPRNVAVDIKNTLANIEDKIALSRKNIAEESAKMLKLKEEAKKLSQKYKIVATELRNISTAITLNKKEQRTVQNNLSRIRVQHQMLLKSSNFNHSTGVPTPVNQLNSKIVVSRLQKENNPTKGDHSFSTMLKAVTVSVVNDLRKDNVDPGSKISIQVDVGNNKKTVKLPKSPDKERVVQFNEDINKRETTVVSKELNFDTTNVSLPDTEKVDTLNRREDKDLNDYESPLQAFGSTTWEEDPNAVLCPYEVAGSCRDPGCKFLHPKATRQ